MFVSGFVRTGNPAIVIMHYVKEVREVIIIIKEKGKESFGMEVKWEKPEKLKGGLNLNIEIPKNAKNKKQKTKKSLWIVLSVKEL